MSHFKDQLKSQLSTITINADNVLSIGAQTDDKVYFKGVDCKEWKTLDIDESFNPDVVFNMNHPIMEDDGDLNVDDSLTEHFNTVLALNLWEYIYDPLTAHKNIYRFLKPGGVYIGSYLFVYGKHPPNGTDYLRYTDDGIRKILTAAHFTNIEITPIKSVDSLTEFYAEEGMRVRKDLDHNVTGYFVRATK